MQDTPRPASRPPEARPVRAPVVARPAPLTAPAAAVGAPEPPGSPLELRALTLGQARLDLLLVLVVGVLGPNLPLVVHGWFGVEGQETVPPALVVASKWGEMLAAVGVLVYLLASHRLRPAAFGLRYERPASQFGWAALTLLAMYGYLFASVLVVQVLVHFGVISLDEQIAQRVEFARKLPMSGSTTLVLLMAVAIHEEVLFRGLLLTYLRRVTGRWSVAVLGVSLIFAALHIQQGTLAVLQVFGLSIVLCMMFAASRSLPALMVAHFVFDLVQFQLIHLLPKLQHLLEQGQGG